MALLLSLIGSYIRPFSYLEYFCSCLINLLINADSAVTPNSDVISGQDSQCVNIANFSNALTLPTQKMEKVTRQSAMFVQEKNNTRYWFNIESLNSIQNIPLDWKIVLEFQYYILPNAYRRIETAFSIKIKPLLKIHKLTKECFNDFQFYGLFHPTVNLSRPTHPAHTIGCFFFLFGINIGNFLRALMRYPWIQTKIVGKKCQLSIFMHNEYIFSFGAHPELLTNREKIFYERDKTNISKYPRCTFCILIE